MFTLYQTSLLVYLNEICIQHVMKLFEGKLFQDYIRMCNSALNTTSFTILILSTSSLSSHTPPSAHPGSSMPFSPRDYVELQVDYWTLTSKPDSTDKGDKASKKEGNKVSLKAGFKSLQVWKCT